MPNYYNKLCFRDKIKPTSEQKIRSQVATAKLQKETCKAVNLKEEKKNDGVEIIEKGHRKGQTRMING